MPWCKYYGSFNPLSLIKYKNSDGEIHGNPDYVDKTKCKSFKNP